jgi:cytochrome c556
MKLRYVKPGVVLGSLVALAVAGSALGQSTMSTADTIAARQKLMKEQGAALRSINEKAKAGQHQAIGPDAEKLVETSKKIPALFPEGSVDPTTSRAKPEIWQKWAEFTGNAKTLESKATELAATSKTGTAEATTAAIADLGKTTCTACHDAFRGPEIKK